MSYSYDYPHPAVAADVALFREINSIQQVLLIKRGQPPFAACWVLPGGFVNIDEDLEDAARRELHEETGLHAGDLVQLQTFGRPDRDPRERVITVVFLGMLAAADSSEPRAGDDADEAGWFNLDALPELAFDHAEIVAVARQRLQTISMLSGRG
ncbi:MAG: NUDIX hydrolase [Gammaproteobacteria bacterium]|nr:NUDIX hydrolase [Gammaproteobacteria bacterium]